MNLYSILLLGILLSLTAVPGAFAHNEPNSATDRSSVYECVRLMDGTFPGGLPIPKIGLDKAKIPYFEFQDVDQAVEYLREAHTSTRQHLEARAQFLVPALNGLWNTFQRSDKKALTGRDRNKINAVTIMWLNTVFQVESFDRLESRELYKIAAKMTASELFSNLKFPIEHANFSEIYGRLNRPPPDRQGQKWLDLFPEAVNTSLTLEQLQDILFSLPLFNLPDATRALMTKIWLQREAELTRIDTLELKKMTFALNSLFLLHPQSAYTYYRRHRSELLVTELDNPKPLIRALLYFKYVMKMDIPPFDEDRLVSLFGADIQSDSSLERKVAQSLQHFGVTFQQNTYDPVAPFIEMDFFIDLDGHRKINIEVDGPSHFIEDGNGGFHRRLADRRRDEILSAMGIEVYRISYHSLQPGLRESTEEAMLDFLIGSP